MFGIFHLVVEYKKISPVICEWKFIAINSHFKQADGLGINATENSFQKYTYSPTYAHFGSLKKPHYGKIA